MGTNRVSLDMSSELGGRLVHFDAVISQMIHLW